MPSTETHNTGTKKNGMPRPGKGSIVVSGIQPSGILHLGNYFGAIRQHIEFHDQYESYFFIVNYHALTSLQDADLLRKYSLNVAMDYLALGFDPDHARLFLQSDVPEVTELAWILLTLTPVSQLEKGVAYKDKVSQGMSANGGLFTYPVLQAADILIYGGTHVPVGADQKQNIEICRNLAQRLNDRFSPENPILHVPEPYILGDVAVVPGTDGRKMSKSYQNTIGIFDEGSMLKKKVMSIVTDSTPLEEPKDPDTCNVFALISDMQKRNYSTLLIHVLKVPAKNGKSLRNILITSWMCSVNRRKRHSSGRTRSCKRYVKPPESSRLFPGDRKVT